MRNGSSDVEKNDTIVDIAQYQSHVDSHDYVEKLTDIAAEDAAKFLDVGIDTAESGRSGTFIQKDRSVIHSHTHQAGLEIMSISQAQQKHAWLADYMWRLVNPDKDDFTSRTQAVAHEGYFIRAEAGLQVAHPVQACLYIAKEGFAQSVHNIVIVEEGAHLQVITGCATSPHLVSGLHVGVSEFYVKKVPNSISP